MWMRLASTDNTGGNMLNADLVLSIGGSTGREVFNFQAGASVNQIAAPSTWSPMRPASPASANAGTLTLNSTDYGSKAIVDTEVVSEGAGGTFKSGLSASRATGTDIVASVNGVTASGDGNTLSINTATLDLSITVDDGELDEL